MDEISKAELHLHLEGSVGPETFAELAPELSRQQIQALYRFRDFAGFLECFKAIVKRLGSPEDYALVLGRLLERLEQQNVRYAEITLSAGVVLWKGQPLAPIYRALRAAAAGSRVEVGWIFDAVRHFGPQPALEVAQLAAERAGDGVVAFGIGGDEQRGPAEWFGEVFRYARAGGLRLTAHAGEASGPESIWAALEIGAERIGHGIRAIEDPVLVRHLRDRGIPLEICISSNLATGAAGRLEEHPAKKLYDAGVPITLNTDDPGIFSTSLSREYLLAGRLGFSPAELEEIARNGFRFAFRGAAAPDQAAITWG